MSSALELTNKIWGAWKILYYTRSKTMPCGTARRFWLVECLECGHRFEKTVRNLRRRREFPQNCEKCRPKRVTKAYIPKVHFDGLKCGAKYSMNRETTTDIEKVTCSYCLKFL